MVTARLSVVAIIFFVTGLFAQAANPVPHINQPLVPSSVPPGTGQFTLTVEGTGFAATSIVEWNGIGLATTFMSQGKLVATVPAGNVGSSGTAQVTVVNPASSDGRSNSVAFTITSPTSSIGFAASPPAGTVLVADFNNDGTPDLLVTAAGGGSVLLGNGNGTFTLKSQISLPTSFLVGAVAGDFNHDGQLDIATISNPNCMGCAEVSIFLGNGDGTFTSGFQTPGVDGAYTGIVAGDFNGDGNLDLATSGSSFGLGFVDVLLGSGDGSFTDVGGPNTPPLVFAPGTLAFGDFNEDGILDLAVADPGSSTGFEIFLGKGDGSLLLLSQPSTSLVSPSSVTTADLNGDGILDLAFANGANGPLVVLLGKGDGLFSQETTGEPIAPSAKSVTSADMNGDAKPDLIVGSSVYLGNGDSTFNAGIATNGQGLASVADFNGDGRLDVAFTNAVLLEVPETEIDTTPPVITVFTNRTTLWPPNGKMVHLIVSGKITDTGLGVNSSTAAFAVLDEYGQVQPRGHVVLGPGGSYSFTILLQASRVGTDKNGRQYKIVVSAKDNAGNIGSASTLVTVLHDKGH